MTEPGQIEDGRTQPAPCDVTQLALQAVRRRVEFFDRALNGGQHLLRDRLTQIDEPGDFADVAHPQRRVELQLDGHDLDRRVAGVVGHGRVLQHRARDLHDLRNESQR